MSPRFKLLIIGAEHDAVQLCALAAFTGWEVVVVAPPTEEKNKMDFPGSRALYPLLPDELQVADIDTQTAVIIMSHNYARDLQFLLRVKDADPVYVGLLGPAKRREKLLSELTERAPDLPLEFFDRIHGPAGLNIGAETPQEIALAILTEILAVVRGQEPMSLKDKKASIHN
jgi:xanthine/CO dehydrogenase XdhC/CoxF family maturation factor